MTVDILVEHVQLFHPDRRELVTGSVAIKHGQVVGVAPSISDTATITIDGKGKVAMPGFMDVHVHFRDLDHGYKETFLSGSKAAVHGGVTTVLCMPNTRPPVISAGILTEYEERARHASFCNVGFIAGFPDEPPELDALAGHGIHGIKIYMEHALGNHDWSKDDELALALQECFKRDIRVHVHPGIARDKGADVAAYHRLVQDGMNPLQAHSSIFSADDEVSGLDRFLALAAAAAAGAPGKVPRVHACHVSCKRAVETIDAWQQRFPGTITWEVAPHHAILSHDMAFEHDTVAKVLQPLRTEADRAFMMDCIASGKAPIMASDHAPHACGEKTGRFEDAISGFPVLDIYAPLVMSACLGHGMTVETIARACAEEPARFIGLDHRKGKIKPRFDADLVLLEHVPPRQVDVEGFHSQSRVSPYKETGITLEWQVTHVIVDGELVIEDGTITGKPGNRILPRRKITLE